LKQNSPKQVAEDCVPETGVLPACAPLANPYVPFQQENAPVYQAPKALIRGTLYPGLDLPFMNMINQKEMTRNPMNRLQAMDFAIGELSLYLDTHPNDTEALELFQTYVETYADALQKFEQDYGASTRYGAGIRGRYDWTDGPWPWEYDANKEV